MEGWGEFKGIVVSPFKVFKAHNAQLALFMLKDKTIYTTAQMAYTVVYENDFFLVIRACGSK